MFRGVGLAKYLDICAPDLECPFVCSLFPKIWMCGKISPTLSSIKFYEKPPIGCRVVTCGRTEGQTAGVAEVIRDYLQVFFPELHVAERLCSVRVHRG